MLNPYACQPAFHAQLQPALDLLPGSTAERGTRETDSLRPGRSLHVLSGPDGSTGTGQLEALGQQAGGDRPRECVGDSGRETLFDVCECPGVLQSTAAVSPSLSRYLVYCLVSHRHSQSLTSDSENPQAQPSQNPIPPSTANPQPRTDPELDPESPPRPTWARSRPSIPAAAASTPHLRFAGGPCSEVHPVALEATGHP